MAAFFGLLLAFVGAARMSPGGGAFAAADDLQQLPRPVDPRLQMSVVTLVRGRGPAAREGDTVEVRYRGKPPGDAAPDGGLFGFVLGEGEVIEGWEEGLVGMRVGEKRKLVIPPALAYGARGHDEVKPGETLHYEVELVSIRPGERGD